MTEKQKCLCPYTLVVPLEQGVNESPPAQDGNIQVHGLHRSPTGFQEVDVGFTGVSLASALRFSRTMDPSRSGGRLNRELGLGQVHSDGTHANSIERACLRRCRRSVASVHRQATPITVGDVPVTCDGAPLASRGDHLERRELRREHWEVQKDEVDDGAVVGRDEASGSGSYPVQYSRKSFSVANSSAWRTTSAETPSARAKSSLRVTIVRGPSSIATPT